MPLKVLIIPDKFKGTLTARAAAEAIARGWRKVRPADTFDLLPMCDGGDGFGAILGDLLGAKVLTTRTIDAAHRPCAASWWWEPNRKIAIVESAMVIGLAMLPPGKFHPFDLDSFGLGLALRTAAAKGARRCLVGIGGSATNDGGFGLARALGWQFLDRSGKPILHWTELTALARIRAPRRRRWFRELTVAVDVRNPLSGARGATRVYGQQKGLRRSDFSQAERCLRRLAAVFRRDFGPAFARIPGAGAAGGLGFGLLAFLGARLESGFDVFARQAGLEHRLHGAELVLTGEGAIDRQTLMGKGVGRIAERCRKLGRPCIGLAGVLEPGVAARGIFTTLHSLVEMTGVAQAKSHPSPWLERLATQVARDWSKRAT